MKTVIHHPLVRLVIGVAVVAAALLIGQVLLGIVRNGLGLASAETANYAALVLFLPMLLCAYAGYVRAIEHRAPRELGGSGAAVELGAGLLIGIGLFSAVVAALWLARVYRADAGNPAWTALPAALAGAIVSALAQELIFRATIFRILSGWLGLWPALAISAALFGLLHLVNVGATWWSALTIALQAGLLLGAAYAFTGRLWLALGLHVGWDFANDGVFGTGIAGQTGERIHSLLHAELSGSPALTGGAFGVEASIAALAIALAATAVLLFALRMRNRRPPSPMPTTSST